MQKSSVKFCNDCRTSKPLSDFHVASRNNVDGRQSKCKPCKKIYADSRLDKKQAYDIKYREKNEDHLKSISKEYRKTDKYKKMHYLSNKKYRANNQEKYKAHGKVNSLKQAGKLSESPCKCGATENLHAHHHDYTKPLDIEWLCPPCHKKLHRTVNV